MDGAVADERGRVVARRESRGRPMSVMDVLVAATPQIHSLIVVMREMADFQAYVKSVLNPWN